MNKPIEIGGSFSISRSSPSIDALRGYAILMVLAMHVISHVPSMVWPLKRLMLLGSNGVQLFFLTSAITLLTSWEYNSKISPNVGAAQFFVKRFFRIAPLYFIAIAYYWIFHRTSSDTLDSQKLLASMLFYNAWSPYLIPTVPGWTPVPGGWSISVEYSFYMIFPFLAVTITNLRRAFIFIFVSYFVMVLGYIFGAQLYPEISSEARNRFLFFWPPNHLIIFALGFLAFRALQTAKVRTAIQTSGVNAFSASVLLLLLIIPLQFYPGSKLSELFLMPPVHILLSALFVPWILIVILEPHKLIISPLIVAIGKMSFSMYLIHFSILPLAVWILNKIWTGSKDGLMSVAFSAIVLTLATLVSYLIATVTYRFIEQPFIEYGRKLCLLMNERMRFASRDLEERKLQ